MTPPLQPGSEVPISGPAPGPVSDLGPAPGTEGAAAASLRSATLLAAAGGSLDSFLYLQHGHVFAGAMTGNAVLCGIALLGDDHREAIRHALPLLAFFCGVWLSEFMQTHVKHHAVTLGLAGEITGLLIASFLPRTFPDLVFVPWIALLAAYQIASFRRADQYSYNSTFITGDLRTAVVGLYRALDPATRTAGLRQARELGLIVGCFLVGAVVGALLAPRFGNHALWAPVCALLVVLVTVFQAFRASGGG